MKYKLKLHHYLMIYIVLIILIVYFSYVQTKKEPFQLLLNGDYPLTKRQNLTNDSSSTLWKDYPVFGSSYKQLTNNLKYFRNPDIGICTPETMCGAFYKDKKHPKNTAKWLPPVSTPNNKIRVNYFNTDPNLLI